MKFWEVIKELTDDPTKKFELSDRGSRERIGSDGNYLRYSRIDHGMVSDGPALEDNVDVNNNDWQLVRQPVTWQEAIQAWVAGKKVSYSYMGYDKRFLFEDSNTMMSTEKVKNAEWYVEE